MSRIHLLACGAVAVALLPLSACSSHGRVGFGGDLGGSASGSAGSGGSNAGSTGGFAETANGALASVGNLITGDDTGLPQLGSVAPLGNVTVADQGVVEGGQGGAVGLSMASDTQNEGEYASLGVLQNGQVIGANEITPIAGSSDVLGLSTDGQQLVGDGDQQQVDVGLLSSGGSGDVANLDLLSGDQTADASIAGGQSGLGGLTDQVAGVLAGN